MEMDRRRFGGEIFFKWINEKQKWYASIMN